MPGSALSTCRSLDRAIGAQSCPDWERCSAPHYTLVALDRAIGAQSCPDWERCSYMSAKRNGRTSKLVLPFLFVLMHDHACDKIRTRDLLVRSQTLYPAELRAHKRFSQTQVLYYRREGQMSSINLNFFTSCRSCYFQHSTGRRGPSGCSGSRLRRWRCRFPYRGGRLGSWRILRRCWCR